MFTANRRTRLTKTARREARSSTIVRIVAMRNPTDPALMAALPKSIRDTDELETLLSEPSENTVRTLRNLDGDILVLGVGGKMGPTLARMAKRASHLAGIRRRVIGVSRFS